MAAKGGHDKTAEQQDFEALQREYRHMEIERRAYAEESHALLRKQQATIEKLRRDNEQLKSELALEMRSATKPTSSFDQALLSKLQDQLDKYAMGNTEEKGKITDMEKQISLLKAKIAQQRKVMGGVNAARDNQAMINKQIRILENRLDKALIKFNEALAHNKRLRETIDDLRRERVVFDNVYKKLERELQEKKKQMANIIELSNLAYEQRDNVQMEVAAIEQANRKEQEDFNEQMMELNKLLDNDLQQAESKEVQVGEMSPEQEKTLRRKLNKGVWDMTKQKMDVQQAMDRVQSFEDAFNKIKAATGISDIEELVRTFIKNEEQNFSLFNYVNEQQNEIEKLDEQIQLLREEEVKYSQESGDDVNLHKQILKDLQAKLQSTEGAAEKFELKCQEAQKIMESLKKGIQSIFDKVGGKGLSEILSSSSVTETNIMQFLGLIEQRANEVLKLYLNLKQEEEERLAQAVAAAGKASSALNKSMANILGVGPNVPMGQELIHVNPPKLEDYSSDDGSDEEAEDARPLTREELKSKTLNRLNRRANKEAAKARAKGAKAQGGRA